MNKEQIYEIQNKLIDEIMGDAWVGNNDEDNTKSLFYISGVRETIDEIIKLMNERVCEANED